MAGDAAPAQVFPGSSGGAAVVGATHHRFDDCLNIAGAHRRDGALVHRLRDGKRIWYRRATIDVRWRDRGRERVRRFPISAAPPPR